MLVGMDSPSFAANVRLGPQAWQSYIGYGDTFSRTLSSF